MAINPVGQGTAAISAATTVQKQSVKTAEGAPAVSTQNKDIAIISQKAKDLAALKAGKTASEEANESMSAKAQEASDVD